MDIPAPTPSTIQADRIQLPPNARAADPGLVASIAKDGLLHPVGVVATGPDSYRIIYGARRVAALLKLRLPVAANVYPADLSEEAALALMLEENLHRKDATPLEQGEGFLALAALGLSQAEIARRVAKPASFVAARITLAQLPKPILAILETIPFSVSAVAILARLPHAKMQQLIEENPYVASDVQAAQDAIRRDGPDLSAAQFDAAGCGDCQHREEDICLDESCYAEKTAAHVSASISRIRRKHPNAPCVTLEGAGPFPSPQDREIFQSHKAEILRDWRPAAPGEKGTREGILLGVGGSVRHVALVPVQRKKDGRAVNRHLPADVQTERAATNALLRELRRRIAEGPRQIDPAAFGTLCANLAAAVTGLPDLDLPGAFHALLSNAAHRLRIGLESVPPDASPEERHAANVAVARLLFDDPESELADLASP